MITSYFFLDQDSFFKLKPYKILEDCHVLQNIDYSALKMVKDKLSLYYFEFSFVQNRCNFIGKFLAI